MKLQMFRVHTLVMAALGFVMFSGIALAGPGMGAGHGRRGGGWMANLSQEQIDKLDAERQAFWSATADLRQQIRQKSLEQRAELAKKEPDAGRLKALQQEISALGAQLDQKEIDHLLAMRKIAPEGFMGMGYSGAMAGRHGDGMGMGRGMMMHGGMGRGMMMGLDCPRLADAPAQPNN
jgi:Spy/CpxP family protein refolding chaperone